METTHDADPASICVSSQPRGGEANMNSLSGRNLQQLGLKHGDLIFVSYKSLATETAAPSNVNGTQHAAPVPAPAATARPWELAQEAEVDLYWRQRDGQLKRGRDPRFCKHGPNAMCDYCMPLEPFDAAYHASHAIKHVSYHAWLRKLAPSAHSSTASLPPLVPLAYGVKTPCPSGNHAPWPAGICTSCQPSAITLQPQPFRMVDHVEFAQVAVIDRFLHAWRATGAQRFGWLIGRYEPYEEVPMGIKAVVEAIHEPPQEDELDGLSLTLPWDDQARVSRLAGDAVAPLCIVGQIFTDLTPDPEDKTRSLYKRHAQSFYLSGLETIFAATLQLETPTPTRASPTGAYGSRMVTAVLCGSEDGGIDVRAYQASEQACAMVAADMIEASVDPGVIRVKEEDRSAGAARYVPDVFFRFKNSYGIDVKQSAKPCFPVEYLLVNLTHGFPNAPNPRLRVCEFAIENRPGIESQTLDAALSSLRQLGAVDLIDSRTARGGAPQIARARTVRFLSDWHLLAFLDATGILAREEMRAIVRAATAPDLDDPAVLDGVVNTDGWRNLMAIARESAPASRVPAPAAHIDEDLPADVLNAIADNGPGAAAAGAAGVRTCPHCTFENAHGGSDCELCGLPLG